MTVLPSGGGLIPLSLFQYMFGLICGVFLAAAASSHAIHSILNEDFNHVVNYSVSYYHKNKLILPAYIDHYQRTRVRTNATFVCTVSRVPMY